MKKLKSIFRVYFLGLLGIFSFFYYVLSFKLEYAWYPISEIPAITSMSCYSMALVSSYFYIKRDVIGAEYQSIKNDYLNWLGKQNSFIVFLVSIPVNLVILVCQIGLIEIILHFSNSSIPTASDISLFLVIIINFFIIRTYVFKYEGKNYTYQVKFYTVISIISLIVNYFSVQGIVNNFDWFNNMLVGIPEEITGIIGFEATPQFITSALTGWVWFLCHERITFKK